MSPFGSSIWARSGVVLWIIAAVGLLASLAAVVWHAPIEAQMGVVQKIIYVHVPSAVATLIAFFITFAASVAFLATRRWEWDAVAVSACEVGMVFATVVLLSGPLWARSAWNTWWTWEPRLTSFLILWILYGGYHIVRASVGDGSKRALSSVLGIVLFVMIPIVWKSVEWWRGSLHPRSVTMTGAMRETLLLSMLAWIAFFFAALRQRMSLEWIREGEAEPDAGGAARRAPAEAEGR
jgi:heme exporter protein C